METAREIITSAYRKIRVKRAGFELTAEEAADGLEQLNSMIGAWSADNLKIPARTIESFTLTAGQNPHTIGPSGDLVTSMPTSVEEVVLSSDNNRYRMKVGTAQDYADIPDLTVQGLPDWAWYEEGTTNGSLYFDLAPQEAYSVEINSLKRLTEFATLTTQTTLPREYHNAMVFNLAVNLAYEFSKESMIPMLQAQAKPLLTNLMRKTAAERVPPLEYDASLVRNLDRYDINTGYR